MFNSTHTLVGLAAARTGLEKWAPRAVWTAVIASNLPDIDILAQFAGTTSYLDHHRAITHTILGTPILSLALAAIMAASGGFLFRHFLVALIAMSTHPLLDWANTYGVRPFLPFHPDWYFGDTLFIIDPWLDLILLIGVVLSYKVAKRRKTIVVATLTIALGYIAGMIALRDVARHRFETVVEKLPGVVKVAVGPEFLNPFEWTGFVETHQDVSSYRIDLRDGNVREENRLTNAPASRITAAAEATRTAGVFRSFARFPVMRVEQQQSGYRVLLIDFRFYRASGNTALLAEIILNNDLRVLHESMSFTGSTD